MHRDEVVVFRTFDSDRLRAAKRSDAALGVLRSRGCTAKPSRRSIELRATCLLRDAKVTER
jgi:hypothetical protein